ncbi:G patch domain-containing protein 11 [Halotydeus destructor]|nr:G patch domain-containing protein 11 [Halotydeus destructor]
MSLKQPVSEDEEEDYMSEDFLKSLEKNDVRPGLQFSQSAKRKFEIEKKTLAAPKQSRVELEAENREEGLNKPLDSSNKGFRLLQKMGFASTISEATEKLKAAEPLRPEMKSDRLGVGSKSTVNLQTERRELTAEMVKKTEEEYKRDVRAKKLKSLQLSDLRKCQSCCYQLDSETGSTEPCQRWYWPKSARPSLEIPDETDDSLEEDPEDGIELEDTELKLENLISWLRENYFYCIYCGIKFASCDDMSSHCAGRSREDHDD